MVGLRSLRSLVPPYLARVSACPLLSASSSSDQILTTPPPRSIEASLRASSEKVIAPIAPQWPGSSRSSFAERTSQTWIFHGGLDPLPHSATASLLRSFERTGS